MVSRINPATPDWILPNVRENFHHAKSEIDELQEIAAMTFMTLNTEQTVTGEKLFEADRLRVETFTPTGGPPPLVRGNLNVSQFLTHVYETRPIYFELLRDTQFNLSPYDDEWVGNFAYFEMMGLLDIGFHYVPGQGPNQFQQIQQITYLRVFVDRDVGFGSYYGSFFHLAGSSTRYGGPIELTLGHALLRLTITSRGTVPGVLIAHGRGQPIYGMSPI